MFVDGKIGRYKIVSKIGSGGMGEVYLAEDSKLDRKIALKILPADVASDSERMHRFVHEAKSASALNHPNIITIYEINDEQDVPFIAMEYVTGETLAKALRGGRPIELKRGLDIAAQVAGALGAAHEAGVVHRDIKPDNIIVRPDGLVKVLDFGLAKLTENDGLSDPEAETIAHRTNPGMILGTASFMSPEQARGKEIDGRSDIFSYGTLLYHMLTGRLPFVGENYIDVIASILHNEPPPFSATVTGIPSSIETLVRKCLRKNRDERFQTVKELLADLKDIRQELELDVRSGQRVSLVSSNLLVQPTDDGLQAPFSTDGHTPLNTSSISQILMAEARLHPVRVVLGAVLFLAVVAGFGVGISRLTATSIATAAFQNMRFAKITSTGNVVTEQIAISPDGKFVVYVAYEDGKQSIWVKQAEAPSSIQTVPPSDVDYRGLSISRDANHVYYIARVASGETTLYKMPVLGGVPRKLFSDIIGPVSFSADGKQISFVRDETKLMVANIDGTGVRQLTDGPNAVRFLNSTWSPDSSKIMASVYSPIDNLCRLIEVSVADGAVKPMRGPDWIRISGLAWLPTGEGVVLTGRDLETQLSQVWFVSYPDGESRRITNDLGNYLGLSLSFDGQAIASVQQNRITNIWTTTQKAGYHSERVTANVGRDEGMSGVAWMPDGRIAHTVRATALQDIWISDRNGSQQLTFNARANFSPAVSRDGKAIAFVSTRAGGPDIWKMDSNGENQVSLTNQEGIEGEPEFTPDGKWVIYQLTDLGNRSSIWKVSVDGGDPIPLIKDECARPEISPDGQTIACMYGEPRSGISTQMALYPISGGAFQRIINLPHVMRSRVFRWSGDGKSILYIDGRNRIDNIWSQPIAGGEPRQLTFFESNRIYRFDVSPSNGDLVLSRGSESSDAVMVTNIN